MQAPVTAVKIEKLDAGTNGTLTQATIERYGRSERKFWISPASASRISRAVHGRYISRWPLCGRRGWLAQLYVSDDQIRAYYRQFATRGA